MIIPISINRLKDRAIMSSTTINKPHVLIIGGGMGGLTLAQSLRKQGISFEVFERDANDQSRMQGWAIGLHTYAISAIHPSLSRIPRSTGAGRANTLCRMLEELGDSMPSDMPDLRKSTHHLLPLNLNTQICLHYPGISSRIGVQDTPKTPCLRANRKALRKWLSTAIDIQWGKRVKSVEQVGDKVVAHFEDGTVASGDILVGADGTNSVGKFSWPRGNSRGSK
jgi:flavin-dependent dehydrogenase